MIIISHRGNINGRNPNLENEPNYIQSALDLGFDVEVDVWYKNKNFFLGHDEPKYEVDQNWFNCKNLWCHAKNKEALEEMIINDNVKCFWHEKDKMTIVNNGTLWLYPGNYSQLGITVFLGKPKNIIPEMLGVCTDYPNLWKNKK